MHLVFGQLTAADPSQSSRGGIRRNWLLPDSVDTGMTLAIALTCVVEARPSTGPPTNSIVACRWRTASVASLRRGGRSSGWQDIQQRQGGFLSDEPNSGLLPERINQQGADPSELWMVALQTENTVVALEVHPGSIGILFPELAGHVVVGADQFRDCISLSEADADGMLAISLRRARWR